jgi:hypothetical protein
MADIHSLYTNCLAKGVQMSNVMDFEFKTPYLHETPYEDEPDETYRSLAFDTPEAVLPYAKQNPAIEPGSIKWELDYTLEEALQKWAIAALNLTLTPNVNLKRLDHERLDRWFSRLQAKIRTDLQMWLENDPRYHELIRDRVNEAIKELLCSRK